MASPLRIVLVASFAYDKYGQRFNVSADSKIATGLIRCGHAVVPFSYRDVARYEAPLRSKLFGARRMNARLLEMCGHVEPDLVLFGHSEIVRPETLAAIRERLPRVKMALWYQDPLWATEKLGHIHDRLPYLDAVFLSTGGEYRHSFKTADNVVAFFPSPVDAAIERHRGFARTDLPIDLLFCGRVSKDATDRAGFMEQLRQRLAGLRFDANGVFGNPLVFGAGYDKKLATSAMGLNYSRRNDCPLYSSDRLWQLTGNGLLTLTPRVPGMDRLFTEDEVVYFDSIDDLVESAHRYHRDDAARRRVAEAGWKRAQRSFDTRRVATYLIETIYRMPFSEPYEWADQTL